MKKKTFLVISTVLFALLLILSICYIAGTQNAGKADELYDELASIKNSATTSASESGIVEDSATIADNSGNTEGISDVETESSDSTYADTQDDALEGATDETSSTSSLSKDEILAMYAELYGMNDDLVGWITVDGTIIDFPVMQSIDNPNFYLRHLFNGTYNKRGCPYVPEDCDVLTADNIIIYGHNFSTDNSMFGDLENYESKSFWEIYNTFKFDTLYEEGEYEIVYVLKTTAYKSTSFRYYDYTVFADEDMFNEFVAKCEELKLYDTGLTLAYGDKLVTLSTCDHTATAVADGRIVIVGRKIS